MSENTLQKNLTEAMLFVLKETFENVHGVYLDRGTSIFETLETITAKEASIPDSANCATIAAHVAHMTFYIETTLKFIRGEQPEVDWSEIWNTVREVTPEQWEVSKQKLRESYNQIRDVMQTWEAWKDVNEIGGTLGILTHNAYHLGEIRHTLCTIKPDR